MTLAQAIVHLGDKYCFAKQQERIPEKRPTPQYLLKSYRKKLHGTTLGIRESKEL